ncbi:testicular acid phosphatase homolog [Anabrus simplex]|uniref:testicular acid phosphatase homolog n=1 Tax=Anabrus simplex TaxID=316456 RepID=UPI0035A3B104
MPEYTGRSCLPRQFLRRKCTCFVVVLLGLFICITLLAFLAFGKTGKVSSSLLQVSVLFRHGDRNPTETYPNDPYKEWAEGWGSLTKKGKMQMFEMGEKLRTYYDGFLSDIYSPDDILILSSDNDRCLMSAETYLAGLYPPHESQKWHPDLNWQPIPVHSTPRNLDSLIVVKKPCPKYDEDLKNAYNSPEIAALNEQNQELYDYLSKNAGQEVHNITAVEFLFNTLEIEASHHLKLPDWTASVFPDKMKTLAARSLAIFTETNDMKRSRGGPLVKLMTEHMTAKRAGTLKPNRRMFLYSAHDITIVNVWRTLGFSELLKPGYGASLLLELHLANHGTDHEVKILYINDTTTKDPQALSIPGCESPCLLDSFLEHVKPVIPDDWEKECKLT